MTIDDDIQKAATAVALEICQSSEGIPAIIARAIQAERDAGKEGK